MVHVHALRAGVKASRPTTDVDLQLNIETASAAEVARALIRLGFETVDPYGNNPVHRFTRGADVVDVMVARNVHFPTRWNQRPLLRSPGTAQALDRRDTYSLINGARSVEMQVPDALGAMIAKAAAYAVDPAIHRGISRTLLCSVPPLVRPAHLVSTRSRQRIDDI